MLVPCIRPQKWANYAFTVNIPDDSTNLYFHLPGLMGYSWIGQETEF